MIFLLIALIIIAIGLFLAFRPRKEPRTELPGVDGGSTPGSWKQFTPGSWKQFEGRLHRKPAPAASRPPKPANYRDTGTCDECLRRGRVRDDKSKKKCWTCGTVGCSPMEHAGWDPNDGA